MNTRAILKLSGILALITLAFSSCKKECLHAKGKGDIVSKEVSLESFNQISNTLSIPVYVTQGDTQKVTVHGYGNIIDLVSLKVKDGFLVISLTTLCGSVNDSNLWIEITIPQATALHLSGSGSIEVQGSLLTETMELKCSGSGNITASIEASSSLSAHISGSGNIFLSGTTSSEDFRVSGSGNIRSFALISEHADVHISGSGNVDAFVNEHLNATISGSGTIRYKGNASATSSISGSGQVTHFP